ncbi:FMN-binding protein [Cellulomonas sp. McL0617]|uniref:FMN-binding protein n=1 Tax=Cellulomonas sp. McL0617 TaxID=3415675 RepID=UPI003CF33E09
MRTPTRSTVALVSGASVVAALAACSDGMPSHPAGPSTAAVAGGATITEAEPTAADPSASGYTDGTYTAAGSYQSPQGKESIEVSVKLSGGVITAVEVEPKATNPTSAQYQHDFASGIAEAVVGKKITDADVDVVSGSSLTSEGFNAALAEIAADAKA